MLDLKSINIKKLNSWDKNEFNKFYLETVDFFFRWVKWMYMISDQDINDILSDFYYKLWINKWNFPEEIKEFQKWLWVVFKNLLKDYFKRKDLVYFSEYTDNEENEIKFEDYLISEEDILESIDKDLKIEKIKKLLSNLWEIYKEVLFLKYVEWYSNKEIAEILWISEDLVRKRISRGIKLLKDKM